MEEQIRSGQYNISLFSDRARGGAVVLLSSENEAAQVWQLLQKPRPSLIAVSGMNWNRDLSPWPAAGVFRDGGDFSGGGGLFLRFLTSSILPEALSHLEYVPEFLSIAGYSLAGLFSIWALWNTDVFTRAASMSGSLWFDGFTDLIESTPPKVVPDRVYLSVGSKEKRTKNARMSLVEDKTRATESRLRALGASTVMEINPGGHFNAVPSRIARGIDYIAGDAVV